MGLAVTRGKYVKGEQKIFLHIGNFAIVFSFCLWVQASRTPVERVDFDLTEIGGEEISLLVGDEYCPKITFVPSFASNKGFSFSSSNQEVLQISGQKIVAVSAGSAVLTVVAADNETIQNTILVRVYDAPIKLGGADVDAALNLRYNELDKKFTFNGIANAVGYTININGEDISLGQRLEFSLEEYAQHHQAFDCGLIAKVRADAPSYSHVAESSDFCAPITIYQVGEVQNVKIEADENGQSYLTFSHPHATNFDLSINGEKQPELTDLSSTKISLMALQNKYAGQMVNLQITALVNSEIAQMYSTAYPSVSRHYEINVLGPVQISLNASVLVWDSMPFAKGYNVFVGGEKVETVDDCSFNLNNLKTVEAGNTYEVYVEPVLSGLNLAKTGGHGNVIKFGKKPTPTLMVENDLLKWQSDQKEFLVEEFKNNELISSLALQANEYGLDEITDEEFEICVSELAETLEGVYYLTSQKASIKLSRLSAPELIYKKQENKFEINNQNNNQLVKEFVLSFAGSEQHFENDDLTRFSYDFKLGENEFGLTAISKGEVEGVHYLNSKPYKLLISKLAQPKSTSLNLNDFELETDANFFSYLTIETETLSESILNLTFDIQKENLKFKSENGMLKSVDEKNYSLPYLFDAGKFYISLLDDNYNLIISELKDAENLSFGLTAFVDGTSETEIASDETTTQFLLAPKSSAAGNEQNIEIQKSNLAAELTDYFVLINKNVLVNLSADNATIENEKIIVKLENLKTSPNVGTVFS